jgi:hypothetical protein
VDDDGTTVTLEWKCPDHTGLPSVTFELQTRLVYEVGWPKSAPGIKQAACKKKNLQPGTTYSFTVRSVSSASGAASPWSIPLRVVTPGAPSQSRAAPAQASDDEERRCDPYNGYPYTFEEFSNYYGGAEEWNKAKSPEAEPKPFFKPSSTAPPPPPHTSRPTPPPPPRSGPSVPPLNKDWACLVCRRKNGVALENCGVCGTAKDYRNDRMGNIRETAESKSAREKERERMRERIRESHAGETRLNNHKPANMPQAHVPSLPPFSGRA